MMRSADNLLLLLKRILLLLLFYSLCRILFLIFNHDFFSSLTSSDVLLAFIHGLRFDICAIVILNLPVIALHFFPVAAFYNRHYQRMIAWLFALINIPALLFNCIDFAYFRFTFRRTTSDVFSIIGLGDDFLKLLPSMLADFWYVMLLFVVLSVLLIRIYAWISANHFSLHRFSSVFSAKRVVFHFLFLLMVVIGFRGGIQYKPINIISAGEFNSAQAAPLALNTSFTIIKSWDEQPLTEMNYFTREKSLEIFSPIHHYKTGNNFSPLNVVVIVLESFSKEYIHTYNPVAHYTPFLDSLISVSLSFPESFANGKRSIDGIPAIVASIPALSNEPFITSIYGGNTFNSLPGLLTKINYSTAFFHGGNNGTMGFDHFARMAGFEKYFGRNEYGNDKDYDGAWGIYDEEFLQYSVRQMTKMKQPFFSCVFTLSSHHPYSVPEKYKGKFSKGTLPIHECIQYADYSLRKFFEAAATLPWFDSTLFVITADHTALSEVPFYHSSVGMYSVPILFYRHNTLPGSASLFTAQHSDILPSILHYLNYNESFVAFGESVFDSSASHFAMSFQNDVYQIIENGFALRADSAGTIALYNFRTDSLLNENIADKNLPVKYSLEKKLRALIQEYNYAMIHNKLCTECKP
jgi:phosphoglycerol transferase MdoB-like AlkP superfamily enzyme